MGPDKESLFKTRKKKIMPVKEEDEKKFWDLGILGKDTATLLFNVVYFYKGKLFGLRAEEHRNLSLKKFEIADNFICFERKMFQRHFIVGCSAGMVGAVGKISAFRQQGPQFDPGSTKIRIFVRPSFPPKPTQLSIPPG